MIAAPLLKLRQKARARWQMASAMQAAGYANLARHHVDMAVRHEQELGRLREPAGAR